MCVYIIKLPPDTLPLCNLAGGNVTSDHDRWGGGEPLLKMSAPLMLRLGVKVC